nr:unnamed protein product [Callosobruchus chinensis]
MKPKRACFTDSDCHTLVDIILLYTDIVECKKSEVVTWKEKDAAWAKIAETYNSATTEPRTSDQLRCKYEDLKKEVRKYEALKRQNLYKTGGGIEQIVTKETIKLLYAKIKSIITLSVQGLDPCEGDSDQIMRKKSGERGRIVGILQYLIRLTCSELIISLMLNIFRCRFKLSS